MNQVTDDELAASLAERAGRMLVDLRASWDSPSAWALGDEGDQSANAFIIRALAEVRPDDAVLSEEAVDHPGRLRSDRVWIVDPLDGTREFRTPGRTDWAVHVALWADDRLTAAAVALPAEGLLFATADPPRVPAPDGGPRRLVVSRSRPPYAALTAAEAIGADVVTLGSAGAKAMAVVRGQVDAYLHTGGQHEWDSAAPVGVALAAGLHASRVDGSPLVYNRPDPWLPDLLICRRELAEPLLEALAGAYM